VAEAMGSGEAGESGSGEVGKPGSGSTLRSAACFPRFPASPRACDQVRSNRSSLIPPRRSSGSRVMVSLTPSTTCAVVDLRTSQVFSPACFTVSIPSRAARRPWRAVRFKPAARAVAALVRRFEVVFRAPDLADFLAGERLAEARFFPLARFPLDRLVDFLVAAICSSSKDETAGNAPVWYR